MMISRRDFLGRDAALLALTGVLPAACKGQKTRAEVLGEVVREVAVPNVRAVVQVSRELRERLRAFASAPSPAGFEVSRSACRAALLAWKSAHAFRNGPLVETNALLRATFWPARPLAIEAAVKSTEPLDDAAIEGLGADAKGLYALEYLLFPLDVDDARAAADLGAPGSERRRALLGALAQNVVNHADTAALVLGEGKAFAARFAAGGQGSVSRIVGQMVGSVETLAVSRLDLVLGLAQSRMLKPAEVEGWPSKSSHLLARAELSAVERLYGNGEDTGIGQLVRPVAPAIHQRVLERLATAAVAVGKLDAPLELVVAKDRPTLAAAFAATKALEVALKVDLASALGVTLTFQTGDGD